MNLGRSIRINKCGVVILGLLFMCILYYLWNSSNGSNGASYAFSKNPNEINLRKLLIGSIQAAQHGGFEVVAVSKTRDLHEKSKGKTKEGANNPVTDADYRSNCVMKNGLLRIFPKLKVISEEDDRQEQCAEVQLFDLDPTVLPESVTVPDERVSIDDVDVWIDPLDATQEYTGRMFSIYSVKPNLNRETIITFLERLHEYVTTMVCVAVKGVPTIGIIHNPFTMKTTWAWRDRALSESLANLKHDADVKHPTIIVSRSHAGAVKEQSKQIFGENAQVISAGGAGFKVLQVIQNNATAYLHTTHIKKWDICAGDAILGAIGGRMSDLHNENIVYNRDTPSLNPNGLLAAALTATHEAYIKRIVESKHFIPGNPGRAQPIPVDTIPISTLSLVTSGPPESAQHASTPPVPLPAHSCVRAIVLDRLPRRYMPSHSSFRNTSTTARWSVSALSPRFRFSCCQPHPATTAVRPSTRADPSEPLDRQIGRTEAVKSMRLASSSMAISFEGLLQTYPGWGTIVRMPTSYARSVNGSLSI
uniref:Putative inositol monophosphatase 3 n=1 Tax=Anopheles culicifacies TaxID=139723 RepID=A0A182MC89_9DIPT